MKRFFDLFACLFVLALFAGCEQETTTVKSPYSGTIIHIGRFSGNVTSLATVSMDDSDTGGRVEPKDGSYYLTIPVNYEFGTESINPLGVTATITKKDGKYYHGTTELSVTGSFDGNFTIAELTAVGGIFTTTPVYFTNLKFTKKY